MSEFTFIRHGQANYGATDEAGYDRLSAIGRQQAAWLGDYLGASGYGFDRVIVGPLNRQRDTGTIIANRLGLPVSTDERLIELDYFGLAQSMKDTHAVPLPTDRPSWMAHLPAVMAAWSDGQIETPTEDFAGFETRINGLLADTEAGGGRTMLVTSGGVIAMMLRHVLGLETASFSKMLLQTHNASMHRYLLEGGERHLQCFNATPHLDGPGRTRHRTFV